MAFPTTLTNAVDGDTEIVAAHLNSLEAKVGVDGSAIVTSLDYLVKNTSSVDPGHKHSALWASDGSPQAVWVDATGQVGIGTTTPQAKLEVKDGTAYFTDSDVSHGMTDFVPTNVYGLMSIESPSAGGLNIQGLSDTSATGLSFVGTIGAADPTDTIPAMMMTAMKKDGTSRVELGSSETVLQILNWAYPLITVLGSGYVGIGVVAPGSKLAVAGLPIYADNAAAVAAGLSSGDFYRTATGAVMATYGSASSASPSVSPSASPSA